MLSKTSLKIGGVGAGIRASKPILAAEERPTFQVLANGGSGGVLHLRLW